MPAPPSTSASAASSVSASRYGRGLRHRVSASAIASSWAPDGDGVRAQPVGMAAAVPALVVVADPPACLRGELAGGHRLADPGMLPDVRPLGRGERRAPAEQRGQQRPLADVVQRRRAVQLRLEVRGPVQRDGERDGEARDLRRVAGVSQHAVDLVGVALQPGPGVRRRARRPPAPPPPPPRAPGQRHVAPVGLRRSRAPRRPGGRARTRTRLPRSSSHTPAEAVTAGPPRTGASMTPRRARSAAATASWPRPRAAARRTPRRRPGRRASPGRAAVVSRRRLDEHGVARPGGRARR